MFGGAKTKNNYFSTPVFFLLRDFFLGEDPEFLGFALYSAPFLFGWMGKTCSETRADTTIRTCMIPKILLANLGNLKYKINVEEPWFCNTSKDGTSLSGNKLAVVTWTMTYWLVMEGYKVRYSKETIFTRWFKPWLFYPLFGGHHQPLISGHVFTHHPQKSHKEPPGT